MRAHRKVGWVVSVSANHSAAFKAKVALAALKGDRTLATAGIAVRRPSEPEPAVESWSGCSAAEAFATTADKREGEPDLKTLLANIGRSQIAGWLKQTYPRDESQYASHETIYRSLFI